MSLLHIETPRLWLRPVQPEDAASMIEMDRDPEVVRFMKAPQLGESEMADAIRRQAAQYYERHQLGILAGVLKATGSLVGRYGLQYVEVDGSDELEVKYLTAGEHRKKGYASEALGGLLLAASSEGIERVVALILTTNTSSRLVAESVGFGLERQITRDGEDISVYSIELT